MAFFFWFGVVYPIQRQEDYLFRHIRIEEGLSQSSVTCMLQDQKGFLWFGTANGLNRYDGYSFKIFSNDPTDSTSLSDNGILSIYEDSKGYIWIGTVEGVLNRYDRRSGIFKQFYITQKIKEEYNPTETPFDFPLPFSRNNNRSITSISEDRKGNIWFGTWGKGLVKFNTATGGFEHFGYKKNNTAKFNSNHIRSILIDKSGKIWVATLGNGLYKIEEKSATLKFTNFVNSKSNSQSLSDNRVTVLTIDNFGNLWVGTFGGGLNKLAAQFLEDTSGKAKFIRFTSNGSGNSLSNNIVTALFEDNEQRLWIGTLGGGLDQYDQFRNRFINFKNDPDNESSITKNEVLSVFQDRSGNIWIGTHLGRGLNKLERKTEKFKHIAKSANRKSGLNDDVVWAISADKESRVWIGTFKGGLNLWDRRSKQFSYFKTNSGSLNDNHIRVIKDDSRGNLLIGTYAGGLNIFNKETKTSRILKNIPGDSTSLGANQVQSILIDREGNYWIGTFGGGLNKIKKEHVAQGIFKFERYTTDPNDPFSISDNRVYCLYEDTEGVLWVGTFGGGINKFDKATGHFIAYKNLPGDKTSLSENRIMSIVEDKNKSIWIGTYGGGLNLFDRNKETFLRLNDKTRLKSSVVYGIIEDNFQHLWMSTDNGLFKLDIPTKQFTQYDQNDGLQNLEFSGGAYYKSENGEMFFGGITGFNYFYPDSVVDNTYVPPIAISSIRIFDEPMREERDTITLAYNQNFFSFEFSALDFTNSSDNQYAFMLEGFDKQWRFVDSRRRIANYTNLPPGDYVFSVIGSNNDGVWNYDGKNVYLIILPPFWKRWWFILAVVVLASALIYYLAAARYRNLLAIEKIKSKLAADLHDNVGSGLTEISILSELTGYEVKSFSDSASHNLASISEKARHLIDSMSDIVWMVNPQRDSFYDLIVRLKDSYSDLMTAAGISYKTTNLEKLSSVKLPMEYKQNLFMIFKEALNNAIKHSKCKKITIEADIVKDKLLLSLSDDGNGIEQHRLDAGNGIRNMKSRAKAIGGNLEIISGSEGTALNFKGKFSTNYKVPFFPFK